MKHEKLISSGERAVYLLAVVSVIAAVCFFAAASSDSEKIDLDGTWEAAYNSIPSYGSRLDAFLLSSEDYSSEMLTLEFKGNCFTATRFVTTSNWSNTSIEEFDGQIIDSFLYIAGYKSVLFPDDVRKLDFNDGWELIDYDLVYNGGDIGKIFRVVSSGTFEILERGDLIKFVFSNGEYGINSFSYEGDVVHIGITNSFARDEKS